MSVPAVHSRDQQKFTLLDRVARHCSKPLHPTAHSRLSPARRGSRFLAESRMEPFALRWLLSAATVESMPAIHISSGSVAAPRKLARG